MGEPLLRVKNLGKHFSVKSSLFGKGRTLRAVDGIDFEVFEGETLGLVGESGCGKTTTGYLVLRLLEPTTGEIWLNGVNLSPFKERDIRRLRKNMQIIFQDPYSSLDSRMVVGKLIEEPLRVHGIAKGDEARRRVMAILERVGMGREHYHRYPHEFSGGQRQRIGIARALVTNPTFVVADEPVSMLDVSVRSEILNLLKDLHREFHLTSVFISHDLSVIRYICDRVAVMYLGKIVELAGQKELFDSPEHPYTKALMSAIPVPNPKVIKRRLMLQGDLPSPVNPPPGCRFHPRCPYAQEICKKDTPEIYSP